MYFRHLILMGVSLVAAAFFPNNAFAEGTTGKPEPQNSVAQTYVSEKIENPIASEKAVPVTFENTNKSQGEAVQKPAENPSNEQTVTITPVSKVPNETNKRIEKVKPSLEKIMKAGEFAEPAAKVKKDRGHTEPDAKVKDVGQTVQEQPYVVTNKLPEVPKSFLPNQTDSHSEIDSQLLGLKAMSETILEERDSSGSITTSCSLNDVQKTDIDEENTNPPNDRKIPLGMEIMKNPPQRTQSLGGGSDTQFSAKAASTISFIANRFNLDEYNALTLFLIYTSCQAKYCHQWTNAPPSPPPKATPFYLTFIANLATCNDK